MNGRERIAAMITEEPVDSLPTMPITMMIAGDEIGVPYGTGVLLGNIDPVRVLRDGTPLTVRHEIETCYRQAGPNYIVGAGCEVPRDTPPDNFQALTAFARSTRPKRTT